MLLGGYGIGGFSASSAQTPPPVGTTVELDARLRLGAPSIHARAVVGRLRAITSDTLVLESAGGPLLRVPVETIEHVERSLGRSRAVGAFRGLGIGILAGGALGAAMVLGGADFCIYISCLRNDPSGAIGGFFIGAVLGAPGGALAGAVFGAEKWQTLDRARSSTQRIRIDLHPGGFEIIHDLEAFESVPAVS